MTSNDDFVAIEMTNDRPQRLKNLVIPKYEYQLEDNIIIIGEDDGKKIQKRCARFNQIFTSLCLSENIETIHNTEIIFGKNSLINASEGENSECLKTLEKIFTFSSNVKISYKNKNEDAYILSYVQKETSNIFEKIKSELKNIAKIHFKIDSIKFGSFYEEYCARENIKFNGSLKKKIDIANNTIQKMTKHTGLNEIYTLTYLQKLMVFSKSSIEKLADEYLKKYSINPTTTIQENINIKLSTSLKKIIDDIYKKKDIGFYDKINAYNIDDNLLKKYINKEGLNYDNFPDTSYTSTINDINGIFENGDDINTAKRNLLRYISSVIYRTIKEINIADNNYKIIIGGISAFQYFIDTVNNNVDMSIFNTSVMDLRLYSFSDFSKIEIYKKKQEYINKITKSIDDELSNTSTINYIKSNFNITILQEAGFYCFQSMVEYVYNQNNSINKYNSKYKINSELSTKIYSQNNIEQYQNLSSCFLKIEFNGIIETINIIDMTASLREEEPFYSNETKQIIFALTPPEIFNQQNNFNIKKYSGYMTINPTLNNELFAVKFNDEENLYVFGIGYLIWDSVRSIRYTINSYRIFLDPNGQNMLNPNQNDIVKKMKENSIISYIERYYKLLKALNEPEKYLNCNSFKSFIENC